MIRRLPYLFLTLLLLACCWAASGQGKVYTRKLRLADFPAKTTKMVLAGNSFLELTLRKEIAVRWRISPFEFCSPDEYGRLRSSADHYFLTLAQEDGIAFLVLSKGGKEGEKDQLRQAFEVVRMPMASVDDPTGRELIFMGAFLDVIQRFVEEAMISDKTAYGGLSAGNGLSLKGRTVYLDPDSADEAFLREEPGALLAVTVAPDPAGPRSSCYKMLISADTHELYFFEKCRYRGPSDAAFSDADTRRFTRRGARVIQTPTADSGAEIGFSANLSESASADRRGPGTLRSKVGKGLQRRRGSGICPVINSRPPVWKTPSVGV